MCAPFLVLIFRKFFAELSMIAILILSAAWVYYFKYISDLSIGPEIARQFPGQLSFFACGVFLTIKPMSHKKLGYLSFFSILFLLLVEDSIAKLIFDPIAYSAIVLFVCGLAVKNINFGKYGDISYGVYLYHFPIIQALIALGIFKINIYIGAALSLLLTIIISFISWHYLEKPFLKRTSHYVVASH
jgi:peptidoglycan/LPS O-acetylase OafA/YrhL